MVAYLIKRFGTMFLTLIGVSLIVFLLVHLVPGDPVHYILGDYVDEESINQLTIQLGLDHPLPVQYWEYIINFIQGDLGNSYIDGTSVSQELLQRIPITAQLALYSIILGTVFGITLGIIAAIKQNTVFDYLTMSVALIGISAPSFWIALFLILLFSYQLGIFPVSGYDGFYSMILPSITLGLLSAGNIARMTRSSMLEVIKQDYIQTARSKGTSAFRWVVGHSLQNALIPIITVIGLQFGQLMAGAVVTETVFALPGIGALVIDSIATRDFPMIQGLVLVMAFSFVIVNFIVDIVYTVVDPRIKYN